MSSDLTPHQRFDRLDDLIRRGMMLRHIWTHTTNEGQECFSLLAALSPEAASACSAAACPSDVVTPWLAHLIFCMVREVSAEREEWRALVCRVAQVGRRCLALTTADLHRCEYAVRAVALREILPFADEASKAIARKLLNLCDQEALGHRQPESDWQAAGHVAFAASKAIFNAPEYKFYAWNRDSAITCGIASCARSCDRATADTAFNAAEACAKSAAPPGATVLSSNVDVDIEIGHAVQRARASAWDRITEATLGILESACAAREAAKVTREGVVLSSSSSPSSPTT